LNRLIQAGHRIVYSAAAPDYRGKELKPETKKARRIVRRRRRRPKYVMGAAVCGFLIAALMVFTCAQIAVLGYRVVALQDEIGELEVANQRLELSIAQLSSLTRVEKVASAELGMLKPEGGHTIAMAGQPEEVPVVDLRNEGQPQPPEAEKPLEKVYQALNEMFNRSKVIGMSQ
jgi:cell division protein FtsL